MLKHFIQVLVELNAAAIKIMRDEDPEKIIIKDAIDQIRCLMSDQSKFFVFVSPPFINIYVTKIWYTTDSNLISSF